MEFREKITAIQTEISVQKGNWNDFGKYKYRSCEDILAALNPLLKKYELFVNLSDKVEAVGNRYYVVVTATLTDGEKSITTSACAREAEVKKGMDEAQITGSASSYARKYALSGLLGLDDEKDADTKDNSVEKTSMAVAPPKKDTGDFVCTFGQKFKGKKLRDIDKSELQNYVNYIMTSGNPVKGQVETFIINAKSFLGEK